MQIDRAVCRHASSCFLLFICTIQCRVVAHPEGSDKPKLALAPGVLHAGGRFGRPYMNSKLTEPSEHSTPYVAAWDANAADPCLDQASGCADFKRSYGCSGCCFGGKGERTSRQMTVAEMCPSVCRPECQASTEAFNSQSLKELGFHMFTDESAYPNPDS